MNIVAHLIKPHVLICLITILPLLCSCAQKGPELPYVSQDETPPGDYMLGAEDVIEVLVWKNPDISRVVTIRPDGKISLPLVGDIKAAGLSPVTLSQEIVEQLKTFYKDPAPVTVIVQQVNSYVIYILGEVRNPGKYTVKSGTTFIEAITLAGGFTEFASSNKIVLLRKEEANNAQALFRIKYRDVLAGKQDNVLLKPSDNIIVPYISFNEDAVILRCKA